MHSPSHKCLALVLTVVMIGSFGLVPVANLIGTAQAALSGISALGLSSPAQPLQLVDSVGMRSLTLSKAQSVEVIVGLQGLSLAGEQAYRAQMGLPPLDGAGQRAYVASLAAAQAPVVAALTAAGASVRYQYRLTYDGIDVVGGRVALTQVISRLPGVQRIDLAQADNLELDSSVPFIFDDATYAQLGGDGTGVTIALIDTGIDYTHATFGGAGTLAAYQAIDPTTLVNSGFPTAKVVGGFDLVGENYDARGATAPGGVCSTTLVPDPNPLDVNGHGTHTASTAAGMEVRDPNTDALLTPHGVAPGALVYEFKVFSGCAADGTASTANSNVIAAIEMAVDPNGDGDTSDHANVISMSLGSDFGRDTTPDSVAANAAVDLGAIVVASAGNAGNVPYITGSPATGSEVISVAAGNDPKIKVQLLGVANSNGADGSYESVEAAITPPLVTTGPVSGLTVSTGLACTPFPAGSLTGMIPLIPRGTCTFHDKILNAQNAGAVAVVVRNNAAGDPIVMGGDSTGLTIPAVMVSQADGVTIRAALTSTTTFTLDPANQLPIPDRLAAFTSAGPRFGDSAIKPDLTAPGVNILSAQVATGTESTSVSGTSFSAPHIAGAAAILREIHPDWTPAEIKDVLMNTATDSSRDGVPYPVALMGAGRARVDVAANSESLVDPGAASFGVQELSGLGKKTYTDTLTLENKGPSTKTFSLGAAFRLASDNDGSIALFFPSTVSVKAGSSVAFGFQLQVNFAKLANPDGVLKETDGFLTLTETSSGGDVLRVPFLVVPIPRAQVALKGNPHSLSNGVPLTFTNKGLRASGVDVFQFGAKNPRENLLPGESSAWLNIRYTGARAYDVEGLGRILEFGVANYGPRSSSSNMQTDILIDANGDGVPDYDVVVADLGPLTGAAISGQMVSAVFSLSTGNGFLEFLVDSENNVAWETAPILLDDLNALGGPTIDNLNPSISYLVVTTDLQTGFADVSGSAMFNVIAPAIDVNVNSFVLPAGASGTIGVLGNGPGGLLVLLENNIGGTGQSLVIPAKLG